VDKVAIQLMKYFGHDGEVVVNDIVDGGGGGGGGGEVESIEWSTMNPVIEWSK
jgi:hypothetical protein